MSSVAVGWEFIETTRADLPHLTAAGKADWLPAQVPGYVHLDLVRNGVIDHPYYRMNEAGCQWIDNTDWTYRTTFTFSPDADFPVRKLFFEQLDTVCTIFLNGTKIAAHDNAFLPLTVDVSTLLNDGDNTLQIEFKSAVTTGNDRMAAYFMKEGMENPRANFYDRSFVRKPQYMYGWDWGPRLVSCGITAPVWIVESTGTPQILDVATNQTHHDDGSVTLHVTVETDQPIGQNTLESSLSDELTYVEINLSKTTDTTYEGEVTVDDPFLWDTEFANLYDLHVELYSPEDDLLDERELKIGLRTIELVREPDEYGESFFFKLNGEPLYALGANWIPDSSFPATVTRDQYRNRLESAKAMGMNMLRVWGGGLMETEAFYDLCDELGILVWQDFPYGCAYYPDDAEHQAIAAKEAEFHVKRLRNRPSLALWCGNNENHTMWDSKWGGEEASPPRYYGEYIYEKALPEVCAALDPSRPYIPSSPVGKDPKFAVENTVDHYNHNMGFVGDSHYWDVWHGRGDWKYYADSNARFSSEFGFSSAASLEVWDEYIGDRAFQPFSHELNWHNKTRKPIEKFMEMVTLHYPMPETVEDLVYYTQLNQRDAMRFGIEHWRRSAFCRGTLIWQINDCWPVQSWALMDCHGNWKAVAHELPRLYFPTLHSLVKTEGKVELHVCQHNTSGEVVPGVYLRAVDLSTGETLQEVHVNDKPVKNDSSAKIAELSTKGLNPKTTIIVSIDEDEQSEYAWTLLCEPKDVQIPAANIVVSVLDDDKIALQTDGPVVDLWLTDPEEGVQFAHNFLTSPTASTWIIQTDGPVEDLVARSLAGLHKVEFTRSPL